MGQFLRDQVITNVTIDERTIQTISDILIDQTNTANAAQQDPQKRLAVTYVIRFDNKGHRFTSVQDVLRFYMQADSVERLIFVMESTESRLSNRLNGAVLEVRLDAPNPASCILTASGDNGAWVDAVFAAISEQLDHCRNWHHIVRNAWTAFLIQILGVAVGFVICLWGASKIAPHLAIENSFALSFLFVLLIFGNIWGYLNQFILRFVAYAFPNVRFKRTSRTSLDWLWQAIVSAVLIPVVLYGLGKLFEYAGTVLGAFVS